MEFWDVTLDRLNWLSVSVPQQFNPNKSYLKIGLIDFRQLREDYWKYYSFDYADHTKTS
jgi:hypothetical protein